MNLKNYLKGKSREEFALNIGTTKNYIDLLVIGQRIPGRKLAEKIELATSGAVNRMELLYPEQEAS